jgi:tetratricopeptide (TPR) repeat protein
MLSKFTKTNFGVKIVNSLFLASVFWQIKHLEHSGLEYWLICQLANLSCTDRNCFYFWLGMLNIACQRFDSGIVYLKFVLYLDPGYLDARLALASLFENTGRYPEAIREYQDLQKYIEDNSFIYFKLGNIYQKQKKYKAVLKLPIS